MTFTVSPILTSLISFIDLSSLFLPVALLFLIVLYMSLRQMRISFVSCQNSNMCAGRPEDFRLIDPETCDRFYRCSGISNVGPLLIDCPPNMWFDPDIQECNFPDAFVCHIYADVEPGIECPSEENPFKVQFIPSMIDCERYYICYHERPIAMRCLEGFYWNQARQMCDNPIDANCSVSCILWPRYWLVLATLLSNLCDGSEIDERFNFWTTN